MNLNLQLFGALRGLESGDRMQLAVDGETVADLRAALVAHAGRQWPGISPGLLGKCAFSTDTEVLRDSDRLPANGRMAVLPPVSGG